MCLHIRSDSQIRTLCLWKAQAECSAEQPKLPVSGSWSAWVEPTDALTGAASGEGDAGAPLDAKQLWKIAKTGNHIFLFCLNCFTL